MAIQVTETLLRAIATKDKQISDGRTLAQKGAFKGTIKSCASSDRTHEQAGYQLDLVSEGLPGWHGATTPWRSGGAAPASCATSTAAGSAAPSL